MNEKKLQRILQIITVITILLIVLILFKGFGETNEIRKTGTASVLPLRKLKRPAPTVTMEENGRGDEAFEFYRKKAAAEPKNSEHYRVLGDISFEKKEYKKAEEYYDASLALAPKREELLAKLIRSLISQRKFLEAKNRLELDKRDMPILNLYRGILASLLNQQEESKKFLAEAKEKGNSEVKEKAEILLKAYEEFGLTSDGKIEHLQTLLAKAFDQIGEYEAAIVLALEAIKSRDDYRDAWIILGHAYYAERKWSDSKAALERSVELDSTHPISHFYLGLAEAALGNKEQSVQEIEKAESLGLSGGAFVALEKAKNFDVLKDYQKALEWYEKALKIKGELAKPEEYIRPIVVAIEHIKDLNRAHELAAENLEQHPKNAVSLNLMGYAEVALLRVVDAKKHLEESLKIDPGLPAAHFNLGKLSESLFDLEAAKKHYEQALDLAKKRKDVSIENAAFKQVSSLSNRTTNYSLPTTN